MPNSLLEAMTMGVPSVASSIPPILEIDNTGAGLVTVPPRDAPGLLREMMRLVNSPAERLRIGQSGRALVARRFDVYENMARALGILERAARLDGTHRGSPPTATPAIHA
jgi:glycosyltransferase involved in cell wall biosynthesis